MLLQLVLLGFAEAATPFAGLEWRPLARSDLVWVDEQRTSGFAVGEFDGTVRPALQAFGGAWVSRRIGVGGALGVARLTNTTQVDDIIRQRHWGVIRPSLDLRIALLRRSVAGDPRRPLPWVIAGIHADVPSARDLSNGYTEDERAAADEASTIERARLAGLGGRVGVGLDYPIAPGLSLGALYTLQWHRGIFRTDDLSIVSQWLATDAAVVLVFEWPQRTPPPDP